MNNTPTSTTWGTRRPGPARYTDAQLAAILTALKTDAAAGDSRALQALLDTGLSANGCQGPRAPLRSLLDISLVQQSEADALFLLERHGAVTCMPSTLLSMCLWSPALTRWLLERGCPIPTGRAGLRFALGTINTVAPASVALLAARGYDFNVPMAFEDDPERMPPLLHACRQLMNPPVAALLQAGASPAARDRAGHGFLHLAVCRASLESDLNYDQWAPELAFFRTVLKEACDARCDLDVRSGAGESALHLAARLGYANKVGILLEHGADLDLRDAQGRSTAALAQEHGHERVGQMIAAWRARRAMDLHLRRGAASTPR